MGITIHYRGKLDDLARLENLCNELADIAEWMGWKSQRLDDDWSELPDARLVYGSDITEIKGNLALKGIMIEPEAKLEDIEFYFDCDGNLRSIMNTVLICEGSLKPEAAWNFVKTQFAGPDIHIWVIGLFKHVKKHYMSKLEVVDDGEYWETGNRKTLEQKMRFIDSKIKLLSTELSSERFGNLSGLSADEIADIIEEILVKKGKKSIDPSSPDQTL